MKPTFFLFISAGLLVGCQQRMDDAAAIQRVLEKEAATWRAGDIAGHAACWAIRPYSRVLVSTPEGVTLDISPALMLRPSPAMGHGGTARQTNYKMSIHADNAWVSHDEVSTALDGQQTYSHEIRLLEKRNQTWQLVGQSIHVYKP